MPTVGETIAEMLQYVFPQYAAAPGRIRDGRMVEWMRVGEIAILRAWVEWVGRTSLVVGDSTPEVK